MEVTAQSPPMFPKYLMRRVSQMQSLMHRLKRREPGENRLRRRKN
jgi:hypothetical protein